MKIFITGASGYLGSQLFNFLQGDHDVFALVRSGSSLKRLIGEPAKVICGIEQGSILSGSIKNLKPDLIINTAALYGRNGENTEELVEANIMFPVRLYEISKKHKIKYFLNTGTSLPDLVSPYSLTKNTFVKLANLSLDENLKFINISLEHFYGPNDNSNKFTTYVMDSCLKNKELNLTSGQQKRDFIYIDDVLNSYRTIIDNIKNIVSGETIEVGSGESPTIREFVETFANITNSKSQLNFGSVPSRANEVMHSCANIERIRSLGWIKEFNLIDGIKQMVLKNE